MEQCTIVLKSKDGNYSYEHFVCKDVKTGCTRAENMAKDLHCELVEISFKKQPKATSDSQEPDLTDVLNMFSCILASQLADVIVEFFTESPKISKLNATNKPTEDQEEEERDEESEENCSINFDEVETKCDFLPFDRVLVRDLDTNTWRADFFCFKNDESPFPFACMRGMYKQCIPYTKETAHLINTKECYKPQK